MSHATRRLVDDLYPIRRRHRLPKFHIPLAAPDPDVVLDLLAAFEQTLRSRDEPRREVAFESRAA